METDVLAIKEKGSTALQTAQGLTIGDNDGFTMAGAFRDSLRAISAEIDATFDGPISAAFKTHVEIVSAKKLHSLPVEEAARVVKNKMIAWDYEQKRLRQLEQARLDRCSRERAEAEALTLALELEKAGLKEEAAQVIEEPIRAEVVLAPNLTPKIDGFSYRSSWRFKITDEALLPRAFLIPDDKKIGAMVRALKAATNIPGVLVIEDKV
ncbi:MAG: hypothetical protein EXR86_12365 [Gammaproteobacteria bacterium]|nr:hypothetical protein [Gammaproteobacteria bacterium]